MAGRNLAPKEDGGSFGKRSVTVNTVLTSSSSLVSFQRMARLVAVP